MNIKGIKSGYGVDTNLKANCMFFLNCDIDESA